MAKTQVV